MAILGHRHPLLPETALFSQGFERDRWSVAGTDWELQQDWGRGNGPTVMSTKSAVLDLGLCTTLGEEDYQIPH